MTTHGNFLFKNLSMILPSPSGSSLPRHLKTKWPPWCSPMGHFYLIFPSSPLGVKAGSVHPRSLPPQDSVHVSCCLLLSSWLPFCLECISLRPNAACPSQLAQMLLPTWSFPWFSKLRAFFSSPSLLKTLDLSRTLWGSPRYKNLFVCPVS